MHKKPNNSKSKISSVSDNKVDLLCKICSCRYKLHQVSLTANFISVCKKKKNESTEQLETKSHLH